MYTYLDLYIRSHFFLFMTYMPIYLFIYVQAFIPDKYFWCGRKTISTRGKKLCICISKVLKPLTSNSYLVPNANNSYLVPNANNSYLVSNANNSYLVPNANNSYLVSNANNSYLVSNTNNSYLVSNANNRYIVSNANVFTIWNDASKCLHYMKWRQ